MRYSPKLAEAWEHFDRGDHTGAVAEARIKWRALYPDDGASEGWLLLGLALDAIEWYDEAVECLTVLCKGSELADNWCHLAVATLHAGKRKLSEEAFEQVRLCHQVSRYAQRPGLFWHLFAYAHALLEAGDLPGTRALLDEIGDGMRRLPNVEPALLVARGMPTFPGLLELAVRYFRAACTPDAGTAWLQALGEGLDAESGRQVARAMKELRETDGCPA